MDIFKRPLATAEDTLEYILYPGPTFHDKSDVTTLATVLDSHVSSLLPNHIWHRDSFELKVINTSHNPDKWVIGGRMRVGDSVDDEWCVVWLLKDISERWDVVVSVFDSDGEFLLIEAAQYLPAWVTPTNSENRVWVYKGHLHLVPLQHVSPPTTKRERRHVSFELDSDNEGAEDLDGDNVYISVPDAIDVVRNPNVNTLVTSEIECVAMRRTKGYPALARQHLHCTKVYLPRDIAVALSNNHDLVQKATEAFYTRDAIQLRASTRMTRFPPTSSVLSTVKMTRVSYSQLVGQKFHPPKVFGEWKEREGTSEWRWRDIGMKIACGFEMLYQESKSRKDVTDQLHGGNALVEAHRNALQRDAEYGTYIRRLYECGYFKGETEGSAIWKQQEDRAAAQFVRSRHVDDANRPSFTTLVNLAISQGDSTLSQHINRQEDSEDWLTVDQSIVDGILQASSSSELQGGFDVDMDEKDKGEALENKMAQEKAQQLHNLAEKVERFVEGEGDLEGAVFEDDLLSEADEISHLTDSDDDMTSESQIGDMKLGMDAERRAAMDKLVPALEPSEYGKMPPIFYSASQKVKPATLDSGIVPVSEPSESIPSSQPEQMRPLIFPRDRFDGVEDSDDESEEAGIDENEDEEDQPTVVGEFEVDMKQEEEDFLEFSREALGITPDMWNDIIKDRRGRGAYLPASALSQVPEEAQNGHVSPLMHSKVTVNSKQQPQGSGHRSNTNSGLGTFEAVMQAMDVELSRAKRDKIAVGGNIISTGHRITQHDESKTKGKQQAEDEGDVELAMDTELQAVLQEASDDDSQEDAEASLDYTLIKNFLESFKGQQGLPGPVSNLASRLQPGWTLPRDER